MKRMSRNALVKFLPTHFSGIFIFDIFRVRIFDHRYSKLKILLMLQASIEEKKEKRIIKLLHKILNLKLSILEIIAVFLTI